MITRPETTWDVDVTVSVTRMPLPVEELTRGERAQYAVFDAPARRREWLVGRQCLREVMNELGLGRDTSTVRFPHPHLSISHSGGAAVAAGSAALGVVGVGVDVEVKTWLRPEAARFFLGEHEQAQTTPADLVRLWTVKEALFKANVGNVGSGLRDYVVHEPTAWCGSARGPEQCASLQYRTTATDHGLMTLAIARRAQRSVK